MTQSLTEAITQALVDTRRPYREYTEQLLSKMNVTHDDQHQSNGSRDQGLLNQWHTISTGATTLLMVSKEAAVTIRPRLGSRSQIRIHGQHKLGKLPTLTVTTR
jgi:hypothetical protein